MYKTIVIAAVLSFILGAAIIKAYGDTPITTCQWPNTCVVK